MKRWLGGFGQIRAATVRERRRSHAPTTGAPRYARLSLLHAGIACVLLATSARAGAPAQDYIGFQGAGPLLGVAPVAIKPPLKERWKFTTPSGGGFEAAAAIVGHDVFVADRYGNLYALDLATGKPRWTYATNRKEGGFVAAPLVVAGTVFLGDVKNIFHAVDAATGAKKWTVDIGAPIHGGANSDGQRVVFGSGKGPLYCYTLEGKQLWTARTEDRINSALAIDHGIVYVAGCDRKLHKFSLADGKDLGKVRFGHVAPGSAVIAGDLALVGLDKGQVVCYDKATLKQKWRYDEVDERAMVYATPAVSDGLAIVGARDSNIHAIDLATGKRKWLAATRGEVDASAVICGPIAYVGSRDKHFYALDVATGKKLWDYEAAGPVNAPAAAAHGVIVVGDMKGNLYCFEAADARP